MTKSGYFLQNQLIICTEKFICHLVRMQGTEKWPFHESPFPVTLWSVTPNSHIKVIPSVWLILKNEMGFIGV